MTNVPNIARHEGHVWDSVSSSRFREMPVVARWEWNGYDDSDFYIAVYDELKDTFFQVETWTTRFAPPKDLYDPAPNASPELVEEYRRRLRKIIHRRNVKDRLNILLPQLENLSACKDDIGLQAYLKLRRWFRGQNENVRYNVGKLMSSKLRSKFRISLRDQILNWAMSEENKYDTPLSPRQLETLCRTYKGHWTY